MKWNGKQILGLLALVMTVLASCSKKAEGLAKHVPKDATYVVAFNLKQMQDKLVKEQMTFENFVSVLKGGDSDSVHAKAMKAYTALKNSGLDTESMMYLYTNLDPSAMTGRGGKGDVVFLIGVTDESKIEGYLKSQDAVKGGVTKGDGFSYANLDENVLLGWNKEYAAMVINFNTASAYSQETTEEGGEQGTVPNLKNEGGSSGVATLGKVFKLAESESVAGVKEYGELAARNADISLWTSTDGLSSMPVPLPKLKDMMKGNYSAYSMNFEEGKVVIDGDGYINEKLKGILSKYAGPSFDMDMLANYPSKNVDGMVGVAFNPELIIAFLKELGFEGMADMTLSQQGLTSAEIAKAFKGEFAFAFSDFAMVSKPSSWDPTYMQQVPSSKWLLNIKVGDKAAFDKLIGKAVEAGALTKEGDKYVMKGAGADNLAISITDKNIVLGSDNAFLSSYLAKSEKIALPDGVADKMKGPTAMFFDIDKLLNAIPPNANDSDYNGILTKSKAMFKDFWMNTENLSGNKIHSGGELRLKDAKGNSLPQIAKYLQYIATEQKRIDEKRKLAYTDYAPTELVAADSAMPAAPMEPAVEVREKVKK
jgi:hypothetical protein